MIATSDPLIWTYKRIALFECLDLTKIQGFRNMDRQREKSKGSTGQVYRTFKSSSLPDGYAMLIRPKPKQLSMAATAKLTGCEHA